MVRNVLSRSLIPVFIIALLASGQNHDYIEALHLSTYYYGANRCGDTKSWCHGACHTRDGERDGIDLSGGWHDCGDHIKFGQTNAVTAACLLLGYNRFPYAFEDRYSQDFSEPPPNGIPDILDEVKIFTDYLIKGLVNGRVYYQVGDKRDHYHVSEPVYASGLEVDLGGEPRYAYYKTEGASNYCGSAAAALALMAISYEEFDQSYADACLAKAIQYYEMGDAKHESVPDYDQQFYDSPGEWKDDMALGAVELYRATGDAKYLTAAKGFFDDEYLLPTGWVLSWSDVAPLVGYELYKETNDNTYKEQLGEEVDDYKQEMAWCGYPHFGGWGSLKYATGAAQVALLYHDISNDEDAYSFGKQITDFCLGTHDNLGGDAPKDFSFLIGYNELNGDFPDAPHHRAAFGKGKDAGSLWADEASDPGSVGYAYQLNGAVVGGPQQECAEYEDNIDNYYTNEVCIYYNAHIVPSIAYIICEEGITPNKQHATFLTKISARSRAPKLVLSSEVYTIDPFTPSDALITVYTITGRKLGTFTVGNQKKIALKKKLRLSNEVVIVKVH